MSRNARFVSVLCAFSASALACSGSGTLALELTDAPPDPAIMDAVIVTVGEIEVHLVPARDDRGDGGEADEAAPGVRGEKGEKGERGEDGGWRALGHLPQSFDLLALQNDVTASLGQFGLPEGKITQIRLRLDPVGPNEIRLKTGAVCRLDVAALEPAVVKINHPFKAVEIEEDHTTRVVIDFDARESLASD